MKCVLFTVERCNDCPLVEHGEFSETRCTMLQGKTVASESIDVECPLPDFEEPNED